MVGFSLGALIARHFAYEHSNTLASLTLFSSIYKRTEEQKIVDIVVTMQPTTPFCLSADIDSCIKILLESKNLNSVFTAMDVHERPEWMFRLKGKHAAELIFGDEIKGEKGVYQSLEKLVTVNGAAYATRRNTLINEGVIISKKTGVHIMPHERSIDIDVPIDFDFAEGLSQAFAFCDDLEKVLGSFLFLGNHWFFGFCRSEEQRLILAAGQGDGQECKGSQCTTTGYPTKTKIHRS